MLAVSVWEVNWDIILRLYMIGKTRTPCYMSVPMSSTLGHVAMFKVTENEVEAVSGLWLCLMHQGHDKRVRGYPQISSSTSIQRLQHEGFEVNETGRTSALDM